MICARRKKMAEWYTSLSDEEVERRITKLPPHLKEIFQEKVHSGMSKRQALFIASSFSWTLKGGNQT